MANRILLQEELGPVRRQAVATSSIYAAPRRTIVATRLLFSAAIALVFAGSTLLPAQEDVVPEEVAADAERAQGRLVRIRLPLVGNADSHIRGTIQRALDQLEVAARQQPDRRPVLVLEFVPSKRGEGYGRGTDFERALSLARYLTSRDLAPVKTVAYLPQSIKGHGVLVALACEEIVMAPGAEIGDAGIDEDDQQPIEPGITSWYQQIAAARKTIPEAIALGMLDSRLEVLKVETEAGTDFILSDQLDELRKQHNLISEETIVPGGALAVFTGSEGREYGFVRYLAENRNGLARVLRLPPEVLIEDQSLVADWYPVMLDVEGPITPRLVRQIKTLIGTQIDQQGVNWIGLRIDSSGGELEDSLQLASAIAALDSTEVRTVAYVPMDASGGAAIVALACDQLVMQPNAHVGGQGTLTLDPEIVDSAAVTIRETLGDATEHGWSLFVALIDPKTTIYQYRNKQSGEVRYLSEDEAAAFPNDDDWERGREISVPGKVLQLDSTQAKELGIAWQVVDNFDEFKQLYGFEVDPATIKPNWALELIEALSSPALAVFLLIVGFVGIYVELHTPGIGVGAFVSSLAFMLFFWSKFLDGTAGWLEVILFVGGLTFLLLELFVVPGLGIFGLGGGLMIIASLVLASQTFILPRTPSQLSELRNSLLVVATASVAMLAIAVALRAYLPQMPLFRTLMLNPTPVEKLADLDHRESVADFSVLIGHQGKTTTDLMPAGKAMIDGRLVDVIAESTIIERDQPIKVVSARGNRIVVRAVELG